MRPNTDTSVPQGCVVALVLFTFNTRDYKNVHLNNCIVKLADDTAILSVLHRDMDPSVYQDEIDLFIKRCDTSHLFQNVKETQEVVFDLRQVTNHEPVVIKSQKITQVSLCRYLGVHKDYPLCWKTR